MTRVRFVLVLAAVAVLQAAGLAWQATRATPSPAVVAYDLAVSLEPGTRHLAGAGTIRWTNRTSAPIDDLRLHLAWNAWRSPGSTWFVEQRFGGNPDLAVRAIDDFAWMDVSRLDRVRENGVADLLRQARYLAPDDGNREDRTLLAAALDEPVAPGETLEVQLAWSGRIPRPYADAGAVGDTFLLRRWFPHVAPADDQGWQARQRHAAAGLPSPFADFTVAMTVPAGWVVGATGHEVSRERAGAAETHRYAASGVTGFAWLTAPDLVEASEDLPVAGGQVRLRWLLRPEHAGALDRYREATRRAVAWFADFAGGYPHPDLTVVDPPAILHPVQAEPLDGLAFPMLVTAGARLSDPPAALSIEQQVIDGISRQAWSLAVSPDPSMHCWMRDGVSAYLAERAIGELLTDGPAPAERLFGGLVGWSWPSLTQPPTPLARARRGAIADPSWQTWSGSRSETANVVVRWLSTIERRVGASVVDAALADYYRLGAGSHPAPEDLFDALRQRIDPTAHAWLDHAYFTSATFDYAAEMADVVAFDEPVHRVVVRRLGDGVFPVDVRVERADGSAETVTWDGRGRWQVFTFAGGAPVTTVTVDPEAVLQLDVDRTNNSWTSRPEAARAASTWAVRWMAWVQELLVTYALVA